MNIIRAKKRSGQLLSLVIEGPQATQFPNVFVNAFNSKSENQAELPPVQDALDEALAWAQANGVAVKVHPTLNVLLRSSKFDTSDYVQISTPLVSLYSNSARLYPHQRAGLDFIALNYVHNKQQVRVLLADDPRLGKSPLALAALSALGVRDDVLILCPKALIAQWEQYVHDWWPEAKTQVLTGTTGQKEREWGDFLAKPNYGRPTAVITNWETLTTKLYPPLHNYDWGGVIGDEAHRLKNAKTQITQAAKKLHARHMLLLSATFVENTPADWWAPLSILAPKRFTSFWRWVGHYVETKDTYFGLSFVGAKNAKHMRAEMAPYVLQRRADDVADMPEKIHETMVAELEPAHREFYAELRKGNVAGWRSEYSQKKFANKLALITALRQAAIHPTLIDNSQFEISQPFEQDGKLGVLTALLTERIPRTEQVLVFSSFVDACFLAAAACTKVDAGRAGVYAGDLADDRRVVDFQTGKLRVLCATPQKGGVGLNLYNANWVIFLDLPWSTIDIRQAEERVRAIGKKGPVYVITLTAARTVDQHIARLIAAKKGNVLESEMIHEAERYLADAQ